MSKVTSVEKIQIAEFVNKINKLHKRYNECNQHFVENQIDFLTKTINSDNYVDLAKQLNFPQELLTHMVFAIARDMNSYDEFNYKKECGSKFCDKFMEIANKFLVERNNKPASTPSAGNIEIGLQHYKDFDWGDDSFVSVPVIFPDFPDRSIFRNICQISEEGWGVVFKLENYGRKHFLEAETEQDQVELLEMIRLMNKFLG